MRESALFGTMFGLGAGAVLVGVTVSRLVVGHAPERAAQEPPGAIAEPAPPAAVTPPPVAVIQSSPPPVVSSAARAEIALSGQHRPLPRKHRRPPAAEKAAPKPAPVIEEMPLGRPPVVAETAPTASIAAREAPAAAPPPAPVMDMPIAHNAPIPDGPIAIVRGGVSRPALRAPGARIIQVEPQ